MSESFWVGIGVVIALAALSVLVLVILRARGRRLPPIEPGAAEAGVEAQRLRDQGHRDGWVP